MPNKTIYVRPADIPLWNKIVESGNKSISSLFSEFLRKQSQKAAEKTGKQK